MTPPKLTNRKELSQLTGLSIDEIRLNEKKLGLDKTRIHINRNVRYSRALALSSLKSLGLIS